jgi:hypothetical protein
LSTTPIEQKVAHEATRGTASYIQIQHAVVIEIGDSDDVFLSHRNNKTEVVDTDWNVFYPGRY